jgi:hypothetical protein
MRHWRLAASFPPTLCRLVVDVSFESTQRGEEEGRRRRGGRRKEKGGKYCS